MAISQVDLMRRISNGEESDGKKPSGGAKKRHAVIRENYRQYFGGSDKTGDHADQPSVDKALSLTREDGDPDMPYDHYKVQEGVYLWDVVESAVADRILARNDKDGAEKNDQIFFSPNNRRMGQTTRASISDDQGTLISALDQLADINLADNRNFQATVGTLVAELRKGEGKTWRAGDEKNLESVLNKKHLDEVINNHAKLEIK